MLYNGEGDYQLNNEQYLVYTMHLIYHLSYFLAYSSLTSPCLLKFLYQARHLSSHVHSCINPGMWAVMFIPVPSQACEQSCLFLHQARHVSSHVYSCTKPGMWAVMFIPVKPGIWAVMFMCVRRIDFAYIFMIFLLDFGAVRHYEIYLFFILLQNTNKDRHFVWV